MKVKGTAEYKLTAWSEYKSRIRFPDFWFQNMEYTIFGRRTSNKTNLLSYLFTPKSRVLLQKLTSFQPIKKFPAFYGTRRFITTFTCAHHLSLSWATSIQSMPPHPTSWRAILILSSNLCLGLPSGLFSCGFPTKTLHTPFLSPIQATCPAYLTFDHPNNIGRRVEFIKIFLLALL